MLSIKEALINFPNAIGIKVYSTATRVEYDWRKDIEVSVRHKASVFSKKYFSKSFVDEYTYRLLTKDDGADDLLNEIEDILYDSFGIVDAEYGVDYDFIYK